MTNHRTSPKFSSEVRERAVRMVLEHRGEHASQWAAIVSIAAKIGCTAQTLIEWVQEGRASTAAASPASTSDERERMKALERENRELRQANEILRKAQRVFCPGGARPPMEAMISFVDAYRDRHGVEPICRVLRSPRRPTTPTSPGVPSRRRRRRVSSATPCSASRSEGFSMRTSKSTACARCGGSCFARATTSAAARWRV